MEAKKLRFADLTLKAMEIQSQIQPKEDLRRRKELQVAKIRQQMKALSEEVTVLRAKFEEVTTEQKALAVELGHQPSTSSPCSSPSQTLSPAGTPIALALPVKAATPPSSTPKKLFTTEEIKKELDAAMDVASEFTDGDEFLTLDETGNIDGAKEDEEMGDEEEEEGS